MLNSVAEFFEDDVNTRMTGHALADRAGHHDRHGLFVAFVLIALYLPIFSLADTIR
jgi:type IV pilus assembly protein PilC